MRGDFTARTKDTLAKRVGYRCSNPHCRQTTEDLTGLLETCQV